MIELYIKSSGYPKEEILKNISVGFEKGRLTSIIGPNGCGKSTLLKTLLGIIPCVDGEVIADGMNVLSSKRKEVARRIAYLSQGKSTPDMTVEQMVLHGRFPHLDYPRRYSARDRQIALDAMKTVGISEYAQYPISSLSGGMRQSAYIAMALAQDTEYIILDEPTTYLDISHQLHLMRTLRELADSGKGIIAVMHDLPIAFTFSDTVVVMNGGKIISQKTPAETCCSDIVKDIFGVRMHFENNEYFYEIKPDGKKEQ